MVETRSVHSKRGVLEALTAIGLPFAVGAVAFGISSIWPWLNAMLLALLIGAVIANTRARNLPGLRDHGRWTKLALRLGIVLFGLKLPFNEVLALGWVGIALIVVTVAVTYFVTCFVGDRMGIERGLVSLIAAGFAVCGAAAIAAIQDTVKAPKEAVGTALALVTLFGSALIGIVPLAANALGLTDTQAGMWAGASIHEVAQVVAAGSLLGAGALAAATVVKLGRVALLAAVNFAASFRTDHAETGGQGPRPAILPWYIVGFMVCVVIRSLEFVPPAVLDVAGILTTVLLSAGMFGLGLGIKATALFPVPWRAVALAGIATITALTVPLPLILVNA